MITTKESRVISKATSIKLATAAKKEEEVILYSAPQIMVA
jgi:hypothetical protein